MNCNCPRIDGYVIIKRDCPNHPEARARRAAADALAATPVEPERDPQADDLACAWADFRKDCGITGNLTLAHKAFKAGWKAAREGDQTAALR